jgi:serine/threonine protein kinase
VYRARHRETGDLAAVKLLAPPAAEPADARRLAREFEALRGLSHPNVVRVLEAGVCEGYSYLAMELVDGLDLRSYLAPAVELGADPRPSPRRAEPVSSDSDEPDTEGLPPPVERGAGAILRFAARLEEADTADPAAPARADDAAPARPPPPPPSRELQALLNAPSRVRRMRDAVAQVCAGIGHVHAHGLVHRDLKPSNIMVDDARRVRIMDFGLVKLPHEGGVAPHAEVVGTYRYMAPEQARGLAVDARADLYSLGVILYELLCGRPPFVADRAAALWHEITSLPPPSVSATNPGVDRRLAFVAERLLQKDPAERFQSARDVVDAMG